MTPDDSGTQAPPWPPAPLPQTADRPMLTLHSLPLFPLSTVLFPGGHLPLRVFEPRYLDMVLKCQHAGAPFGVVALERGSEVLAAGAPIEQLQSVGTLAHIRQLERPQPGLLLITCAGAERFRIDQSSRLKHGLWVADVTLLAADARIAVPSDLRPAADALRRVLGEARQGLPHAGLPADGGAHYDDCGWVANRWCECLPLSLALKQQLLDVDSPLLRLELVTDLLERAGLEQGRPE